MNRLELLSPAGDIDIFKAVINAGADAVYFGGDLFGARAYAKNFSMEDASEAIKYAHIHNRKAYLTVNTLLKNVEIERKLYDYLRQYVETGIDAFIVQDFGVFNFIKTYFPDVHIHASTQMSLCTKYGASFIEEAGAKRIVTARELSIDEIASIHKQCPELEIESFVHGALCVCYSGQCLMSSIIGGRSGNRGRCAQPCRLPYVAKKDNKKIDLPGDYILSPKDFCTINNLPDMIDAGVISFKIEGRMKQMSYAAGVVSVYRHYIDQYLYKGRNNYQVSEKDIRKLLDYGNRSGFTNLYLSLHNGSEMMTFEEPSHNKAITELATVSEKKLPVFCKVDAHIGQPLHIAFYDEEDRRAEAFGPICEVANNRPSTKEDIEKSVSQIGNTDFELSRIDISYDDEIFLPVSWLKKTRREAVEKYTALILNDSDKTILPFEEYVFNKTTSFTDTSNLAVSALTIEQVKIVQEYDFVRDIYVPISLLEAALAISNKRIFAVLPTVIRDKSIEKLKLNIGESGVLACSFDGLGYLTAINYDKSRVVLDYRLYTMSNRAIDSFEKYGFLNNCIPYELSIKELKHRDNSNSQMVIYSKIPLMVTANCTIKNSSGCKKKNDKYVLVDRKNETFDVLCNCDFCYNTIYNGKKYIAFDLKDELSTLSCKQYRIDFSVESEKEIRKILNYYEKVFINGNSFESNEEYTKGHLKRGVE